MSRQERRSGGDRRQSARRNQEVGEPPKDRRGDGQRWQALCRFKHDVIGLINGVGDVIIVALDKGHAIARRVGRFLRPLLRREVLIAVILVLVFMIAVRLVGGPCLSVSFTTLSDIVAVVAAIVPSVKRKRSAERALPVDARRK